jgi:hypothetical protein
MSKQRKDLFRVAAPDKTDVGYKFYPIVRVGRFLPFGYKEDPNDKTILLPVEDELILFEQAKEYLKSYSLRDVATWLSNKSGRYISHVGLSLRAKSEQKRAKESIDSKRLLEQYSTAFKKARRIEETRLGRRTPTEEELDDELFASVCEACPNRCK